MSPAEVDALPWWERRMYVDGMNEEFKPLDEASESPEPRSYAPSQPEATNVLTPEEEARVKAKHERYMRMAPVPGGGQPALETLEESGFTVRKIGE